MRGRRPFLGLLAIGASGAEVISMPPPVSIAARGGSFDVIYEFGDEPRRMGFILSHPQPTLERRVSDFAPRFREGTEAAFSEEVFDQLVVASLHEGGDRDKFEAGDKRYNWSNGQVALQKERVITLASQWAQTDTGFKATAPMMIDFTDANASFSWLCYPATDGSVDVIRVYNGTVWASAGPSTPDFGATIEYILSTEQYLFVALGSGADAYRWDGAAVGSTWAALTGFKANCFAWYQETLHCTLGNQLIPATNNDGSAWGSAVKVGWDGTSISDVAVIRGFMLLAKPEGLYIYDGTDVELMIDARDTYNTSNFKGLREFQGEAYLPWGRTLQKAIINGIRDYTFTDITPDLRGDQDKIDFGHGMPQRCFGGPSRFVYIAFDNGEGVYPELLLYNGLGFHQVYRGTSGEDMQAAGYSPQNGWLVMNVGTGAATAYYTIRKRMRDQSDSEYPDYASSGQFTLPTQDAGYPQILKAWHGVAIKAKNCSAVNTITLDYSTDGSTWTQFAEVVSASSLWQSFPLAGLDGVIFSEELHIRFTLARDPDDVTETPRIEDEIIIRGLSRPESVHIFADKLVVDTNAKLRNGLGKVSDLYTIADMLNFIDELEDAPDPIIRTDRFGRRRRVVNTDFSRSDPDVEPLYTTEERPIISLRFIESFAGITITSEGNTTMTHSVAFTEYADADDLAYWGTFRWGLAPWGS